MGAGYYFEDYLDEPEYAYNLFALVYVLENYFSASDDTTLSRYREEDGTIYPNSRPVSSLTLLRRKINISCV